MSRGRGQAPRRLGASPRSHLRLTFSYTLSGTMRGGPREAKGAEVMAAVGAGHLVIEEELTGAREDVEVAQGGRAVRVRPVEERPAPSDAMELAEVGAEGQSAPLLVVLV